MNKLSLPKTFDELVEQYGIIDTDEVYTNGLKLIPAFRVKQWLMEANINGYTEGLKDSSKVEQKPFGPCDLCRFNPPSSADGKPCTMCPAQKGEQTDESNLEKICEELAAENDDLRDQLAMRDKIDRK